MKSWIRSGVWTMLFLLVLLITLFIFYRDYLYDVLFEDYALFEDRFVYEKIDNYELDFNSNALSVYPQDEINKLYITVLEMNKLSFTNHLNQRDDTSKKTYDIYFYDEKKGFFDSATFVREANGEIAVKGRNPFNDIQKSFKLDLFSKEGLWHKQKIINLEKQEADPLRIRNKLALDIMDDVEQLFTLNTSFVRLFVKDIHESDKEFVDYGLYTQVENLDDLFFINRNLNPNGYIYEVDNFRFQNKSLNTLEDKKDIDTKGDKDNQKFDQLVTDINNSEITTEEIIDTYFEKKHLLNWLSYNILIGNKNVVERDYYLYSPQTNEKWYFIPDDCDASFGRIANAPDWKLGIGNYYNNALFKRILLDDTYRNELIENTEDLANKLTPDYIEEYLNIYYDEFFNNITNEPDFQTLEYSFEEFKIAYFALKDYPSQMLVNFKESLLYPLPFKVSKDINGRSVILSDFNSLMLDGSTVTYSILVSRDKKQNDVVKQLSTQESFTVIEDLEVGVYYIKVTVEDNNGFLQEMSNTYEDEFGKKTNGLIRVEIE